MQAEDRDLEQKADAEGADELDALDLIDSSEELEDEGSLDDVTLEEECRKKPVPAQNGS